MTESTEPNTLIALGRSTAFGHVTVNGGCRTVSGVADGV
jgi:hypothetical protein